jgi:hypothetical protein
MSIISIIPSLVLTLLILAFFRNRFSYEYGEIAEFKVRKISKDYKSETDLTDNFKDLFEDNPTESISETSNPLYYFNFLNSRIATIKSKIESFTIESALISTLTFSAFVSVATSGAIMDNGKLFKPILLPKASFISGHIQSAIQTFFPTKADYFTTLGITSLVCLHYLSRELRLQESIYKWRLNSYPPAGKMKSKAGWE